MKILEVLEYLFPKSGNALVVLVTPVFFYDLFTQTTHQLSNSYFTLSVLKI